MKWSRLFALVFAVALAACSGPTAPYPEPEMPDRPGDDDDPRTGMIFSAETTFFG